MKFSFTRKIVPITTFQWESDFYFPFLKRKFSNRNDIFYSLYFVCHHLCRCSMFMFSHFLLLLSLTSIFNEFFFLLVFFRTSNEIEQRNDNLEMSAKVNDICYSSFSPEDIVATDIYSNRTYHRRYLRVSSVRNIRYVLLSFSAINLLLDIRKKITF